MVRNEHVRVLLSKAAQDEQALDILLSDSNAPLAVMGFLAQQATEKLLKAALKLVGADYPFTHVIDRLIDLLEQAGAGVPSEVNALSVLTPFAADLRYEILPEGHETALDVASARRLVSELRAWVERLAQDRDIDLSAP